MPSSTISFTAEEHADIMASVGGQNGMEVTGVGVYKDGQLIGYDEVRITVNQRGFTVRARPEEEDKDDILTILKKRQVAFLKHGMKALDPNFDPANPDAGDSNES